MRVLRRMIDILKKIIKLEETGLNEFSDTSG
jgi:hypothetical protein